MRKVSLFLMMFSVLLGCQEQPVEKPPLTGLNGKLPDINFRTPAGKLADRISQKYDENDNKNNIANKDKNVPVIRELTPLEIKKPKPVAKVDEGVEQLPTIEKLEAVRKTFPKKELDIKRALPDHVQQLLISVSANDIVKSEKILRIIKKEKDAGKLQKSDIFLVRNLEAYIYHRLGEEEEVYKIVQGNLEHLQQDLSLDIKKIVMIDGKRPVNQGVYTELYSPVYKRGHTAHVYIELMHYKEVKIEGDYYSISLKADLTLKDSLGRFVHNMNHNVGSSKRPLEKIYNENLKKNTNRNKRPMIYQYFKIPIPTSINPGKYVMEIEIIDLNDPVLSSSKKTITFLVE